jgi:endonuclease-3
MKKLKASASAKNERLKSGDAIKNKLADKKVKDRDSIPNKVVVKNRVTAKKSLVSDKIKTSTPLLPGAKKRVHAIHKKVSSFPPVSLPEKKKRATIILKMLNDFMPVPPHPLDHNAGEQAAFTLLIAVLLSAQTTDIQVNKVTPALFKIGGNPRAMAALSEKQILECIRSVGFAPTKAKHIKKLAEILMEKHSGMVPQTFEELEALPGVGHKTASVVMGDIFKIPAFPVDTHIHRLAQRWRLTSGKNVAQTEADLKELFEDKLWHRLHLQIIWYGRMECSARGCDGFTCPICLRLNG